MEKYLTRLNKPTLFCRSCASRVYLNGNNWDRGPSIWWDFLDRTGALQLSLLMAKHENAAKPIIQEAFKMDVEQPIQAGLQEMQTEADILIAPLEKKMLERS